MEVRLSCLWSPPASEVQGGWKAVWSFGNLLSRTKPEVCLRLCVICWFPRTMRWEEVLNIHSLISQWSLGWETEGGKCGQLCMRGREDESRYFLESLSNLLPKGQFVLSVASQLHWILDTLLPDSIESFSGISEGGCFWLNVVLIRVSGILVALIRPFLKASQPALSLVQQGREPALTRWRRKGLRHQQGVETGSESRLRREMK